MSSQDRDTKTAALEWAVLDALKTYTLMTAELMLQAGVGTDIRRIRETCARLHRTKLIAHKPALEINQRGVPHGLYWLRPKGAGILTVADGEDIRTSRRKMNFRTEVPHRLGIVRWNIALRQWAETHQVWLSRVVQDFDPGTVPGSKATRTELKTGTFIPDALAKVTPADGVQRLLVLELERGGGEADPSKFLRRKLPKLKEVVRSDELAAVYQVAGPPLFLCVFQTDVMRERVLARWPVPEAPYWNRCFLKSMDEVQANFDAAWWQPGGRPKRHLFHEPVVRGAY